MDTAKDGERPSRAVIERVTPEVDGARYAVKRVAGDRVGVEADVYADGHDELEVRLQYRHESVEVWDETPMAPIVNDRWQGEFAVPERGVYTYRLQAWTDAFLSWQRDLKKRIEAGQELDQELRAGAMLVRAAAGRAAGEDADRLNQRAEALEKQWNVDLRAGIAVDEALTALMRRYADRAGATTYASGQRIVVQRERAVFSSWYELFPRSTSTTPGEHGTLRDVIARLPYVAAMGFDVLYLPPIHPIGRTNRKGRNNVPEGDPDDPGSPWAIGAVEGGHDAIDPRLGTLADFRALVAAAGEYGLEVALDIAFQCAPDHPWVSEHPSWFRHRPDGSIRYAENPPKRYEDIYPIDFETTDWQALWAALEGVVRFWIDQGVAIFRVDNPHTKPFPFWEWLLGRIHADHPDVIFLAEAFTRPKTMYHLAKIGFDQSYTYFTWRNEKWDLTQYFLELTHTEVKEYFRPNLWPNTPDILHAFLQYGGRPAFLIRLVLAATLSASYGIYGPVFELAISEAREPGSEEYADSEKYELRHWDLDQPHSLRELIARLNAARHENPALQRNDSLRFLDTENDQLIAYLKTSADGRNVVIAVVNLDPRNTQAGFLHLPLGDLGLDWSEPYQLHDQLDGARYVWQGERNYVELNPHVLPAHVLRLRRLERREHDFDYYS